MSKLWRYEEFCEYVGCGIDHAKHMVRDGQVPFIRIGKRKLVRFVPEVIEEWARRGCAESGSNGDAKSPERATTRAQQAAGSVPEGGIGSASTDTQGGGDV